MIVENRWKTVDQYAASLKKNIGHYKKVFLQTSLILWK